MPLTDVIRSAWGASLPSWSFCLSLRHWPVFHAALPSKSTYHTKCVLQLDDQCFVGDIYLLFWGLGYCISPDIPLIYVYACVQTIMNVLNHASSWNPVLFSSLFHNHWVWSLKICSQLPHQDTKARLWVPSKLIDWWYPLGERGSIILYLARELWSMWPWLFYVIKCICSVL